MSRIKGITVTLYTRTQSGTDDFNRPVYTETAVNVDNVLVAPVSDADEVLDTLNLTGHEIIYQLAIPKGDAHTWTGCKVGFFGSLFNVIGEPVEGIEAMIPLSWNRKVKVERIE